MKKHLSIVVMLLVLAVMLTSCSWLPTSLTDKLGIFYTISYDVNGADQSFKNTFVLKDKPFELPTPQRENYEFEGWYTAGGELFTSESPLTASVKLTAKWRQTHYTITYNCGEIAESFTKSAPLGEYPSKPATPEVDGYVFTGWYLDEGYTERYFFDRLLNKDTTLCAKFYDTKLGEYIVISNVEQLMAIGNPPATDESTGEPIVSKYLLACDINCKGETLTPIEEFTGELDGNGYRIFNFEINDTSNIVGFIRTNKGTVKNLYFYDFRYEYSLTKNAERYFGVIAGINNGTIDNCKIDDCTMKINASISGFGHSLNVRIGGVCGYNDGIISNCTSAVEIISETVTSGAKAGSTTSSYMNLRTDLGGVVGHNGKEGNVINCANLGNLSISVDTNSITWSFAGSGYATVASLYGNFGGIIGINEGKVDKSFSNASINVNSLNNVASNETIQYALGGAVGSNEGEITNCYASGNIERSKNKASTTNIGGFVGVNKLKIYNCYASVNANDLSSSNPTYVGTFAGTNKQISGQAQATIAKCFSTGSITLAAKPASIYGPFIGSSTASERDCFYLDTSSISLVTVVDEVETLVPVEFTNATGEVKDADTILSVDFIENTLYFDRDIWLLIDGQLPTIK